MTVVVTGASGHIGAALVRAMLSRRRSVRCLVHNHERALEGLDVELAYGNVCNYDSLCRAFKGADTVYHLAATISLAMDDWRRTEEVNVAGTRKVVEACLSCGVRRLVHFSSIHALVQEPMNLPVDESRPLVSSRRCPPYDRSKAASELEVRKGMERGLDAVIVNPTAVVGPYDYQLSHFGRAFIIMARGELPALVTGGFDWVDVRDVAEGALLAGDKGVAGGRYLLSGNWASVKEISRMAADFYGSKTPRVVFPLALALRAVPFLKLMNAILGKEPLMNEVSLRALKSNRHISHEKASRELGYQPRPLPETMADTLRWYQENGYFNHRGGF